MGGPLDGFVQLGIVQHWDNVRRGLEQWDATSYFYPWPGALGYNDGYLLVGALYSVARSVSLDPFLAQALAFVVIRTVGFAFFILFAREALGLGFGGAVLGAALVTMASNLYIQSGHGQLLTVSFAPLFVWLLWRAGRQVVAGRDLAACAWGWTAAALFGLWLLTAFYTIWFTIFLMLLTALAALPFARIRPLLRWPVLAIGAGFILAAIPFALVYLPKAHETGMHGFGEVLFYSPSLLDFIHVGRGNLLFGAVDGWITDRLRPGFPDMSEHSIGFGPVLLALAIGGGVIAWRERRRSPLMLALALGTACALLLSVRVGQHTLWYLVYSAVPGAGAVRVTARFALLLTLPLAALAVLALERLRRPWLVAPLALLLVAEEFTWQNTAGIDRPAELAFLASVPPAPASCRVFFTEGRSPHLTGTSLDDTYPHNTDAMLISSMLGLPTINGISTFNPPDWELVRPQEPGYFRRIRFYLRRHGMDEASICGLDLTSRAWRSGLPALEPPSVLAAGITHDFGDAAMDPILGIGWERSGPIGRWTIGSEATMTFALPPEAAGRALKLSLHGLPFVWTDGGTSPLHLLANGREIMAWRPVPGRQDLTALIPAELNHAPAIELSLLVDRPGSPSELGLSADDRRLGFFVLSLRLETAEPGS